MTYMGDCLLSKKLRLYCSSQNFSFFCVLISSTNFSQFVSFSFVQVDFCTMRGLIKTKIVFFVAKSNFLSKVAWYLKIF